MAVRPMPAAAAQRRYFSSGAAVSHGPVSPSPFPAWQWQSMIMLRTRACSRQRSQCPVDIGLGPGHRPRIVRLGRGVIPGLLQGASDRADIAGIKGPDIVGVLSGDEFMMVEPQLGAVLKRGIGAE